MNNLRKFFRRIKTLLWTTLTLLTVLAAVLVGIGKLLMPYSDRYQPEFEAWLSKAFNQPVKVESFSGEWKAFGPRISLQGVTLMPEGLESEIAINRAALDVKPLNALIPGRPLYSFRIIGADLALERTGDGRFFISGLGVGKGKQGKKRNSGLRNVALNGEVRLQDVSLSFDDPELEIHTVLTNVNGRLKMDGRRLAAEIQARVTDSDRRRVIGDLDAVISIRLDDEQHLVNARWHVKTGELMAADLVRQLPHHALIPVSGRLNAELWGEWQAGQPQEMQGVVDLREALLSTKSGPLLIDHLNSRLNFRFTHRKNWRLDMADLLVEYAGVEWESEHISLARNLPENLGLWVSADYLELDMPLQLTQKIMANYNTLWPPGVPRRGQGVVTDLDIVLDGKWQLLLAHGQLDDGHFWDWDRGPNVTGVDAGFALDAGEGNISLEGQSVTLDWPRVFRRPVTVAMTDCKLEVLWVQKTYWQFDLNRCRVENDDMAVDGRVRMASSEGKPVVDINVAMERGDMSRFKDYWPENILKERTLHWLRTSLLSGQVSAGRYSMTGDMDDQPFTNRQGRLVASVPVVDAVLRYADDWPRAEQIDAIAEFDGPGMRVHGRIGNSADAVVDNITAVIGNFKKPVLDVVYETSTELPKLSNFLKQTPLLRGLELDPDQFVLTGPADVDGHLLTRLGDSSEPMQVSGNVEFHAGKFTDLVSGVELEAINGVLEYHREGLKGNGMVAAYKGFPVDIELVSDWDADEVFRVSLHGELPVDQVIPAQLLQSEPMFSRASGSSLWVIGLGVSSVEGSEKRETWLDIYSGLEGVSIDLPAPFGKSSDQSWPMLVHYPIRSSKHVMTADIPGRMQFMMELSEEDDSPVRAAIQLDGKVKSMPEQGYFGIYGTTDMFDLDGWIDLVVDRISESESTEGLALHTAEVSADQIMMFNRYFYDVELAMQFEDGVVTGNFNAADIDGLVRYHKNEQGAHSMTAEFERLIMPDPVAQGISMDSNPADLPEMHFFSKEFSYLGLDLGETRIEGYPVKDGFHFASVEAHSSSLIFSARGDWLRNTQGERSDFDIRITSESLGTVFEAMDISSAIQGGQTVVNFDAWWGGPPAAFALADLNGEMDISVIQGNILTADPGAGRMLGLLSLTELPRRLAMDFRDVFDEGFHFDEAKGTMRLEEGTSYTDDLALSSTAAEISIIGSTDLDAQTFDYEFIVRPGVSKTLPVIGAIAGGPAGAAAGIALQALLRNALGEAAEARYTIKGPWTDPVVESVKRPPRQKAGNINPAATDSPAIQIPAGATEQASEINLQNKPENKPESDPDGDAKQGNNTDD